MVTSDALQTHPVVAAGIVSVPVEPQVAPPIRMSNAAAPLLADIEVLEAVLQKPEAMVGAVALHAKVASLYPDASNVVSALSSANLAISPVVERLRDGKLDVVPPKSKRPKSVPA